MDSVRCRLSLRVIATVLLLAAVLLMEADSALAQPTGSASGGSQAGDPVVIIPPSVHDGLPEALRKTAEGAPWISATPTVRFRWPLRWQDWWHVNFYVDVDPTAVLMDYACRGTTYNGHTGNDEMIEDFVAMDEGRYALAAAPGTVVNVLDGYYDRNSAFVGGNPNYVAIQHDDGTRSFYIHLVKWSTMVSTGQRVLEGQPLGLIGSSGNSDGPHLHFEVQNGGLVYEPNAGACRGGPSLWKAQQGHVFDNAAALFDAGITTVKPDYRSIIERLPDVRHIYQNTPSTTLHYFWWKLDDVHVGDVSRLIYRRPDGVVFADWTYTHPAYYPFGWFYWETALPASGSTGTWSLEYRFNGVTKAFFTFVYDRVPGAAPVAAGRTVAVPHAVAMGALEGSDADGDLKEFQIVTSPSNGEVRLYGPRKKQFAYTPASLFGGSDTFTFRVVDGENNASAAATMTMDVTPENENALRLEGEDDYVRVPESGSLSPANAFTLEAWVRRTTGSSDWQLLFDRRHPTLYNNYGFHFYVDPNSVLRLGVGTGSSAAYVTGTTPIPMYRWVHVAATWDGARLKLYVDGKEEGNSTAFSGPISYSGLNGMLLGGSLLAGESFRGEIQEMRLWDVARVAADLAQGATCAFFDAPPPASLRARWAFQGNANDSTSNANHGTLVSGASFARVEPAFPMNCSAQDLDGDGLPDGADNCPLDANPGQEDSDADGSGDACDLCPHLAPASQADSDGDGVGDACDLCPFTGDTEQADADGDGSGDLCDPFPLDPARGVPSDQMLIAAQHDRSTGQTTLTWNAEPRSSSYQVFRGTRDEVRALFYGTCLNALDPDPADTRFVDADSPAVGEAFYYLVVGVAADGTRGPAGRDSNGRQRDLRAKDCL